MKWDIEIAQKKEKENVNASNVKDEVIHISEAESGRKGYFCSGCKAEMQAVKPTKRVSYFRHNPEDVKGEFGDVANISSLFIEFQKHLYEQKVA